MPNRTLALEIGASTLRAALVESTLRSQRVLGFYASPRTPGGDLTAELRAFVAKHELRWDEVLSSLPGDVATQRILTLPFHDRKRLDQTVPFELENHLPFELDEAIVDYQVLGGSDGEALVLAAAVPKATVRAHLEALAAAGIDPRLVDLAPLAALNVLCRAGAALPRTSTLVTVDGGSASVAVFRDGRLRGLRTVTHGAGTNGDGEVLVRDVRWSVAALGGDEALDGDALWIGGTATTSGAAVAVGRALGATPQSIETLRVDAVPPTLRREQAAFAAPLGLALRDGAPGETYGVDFRRGEFAYHREREAVWRHVARTAILAAAAIALMVASFAVENAHLARRRDAVRAQIRSVFTSALPNTRTIVNERAQLATEIAALEKQRQAYGGLSPSAARAIDVLRALTTGAPSDTTFDIDELALDGETVRVRGSTPSYEGVESIKRSLAARPEFRDVQAKDVRASVDGQRVDFRLVLALARDGGTGVAEPEATND